MSSITCTLIDTHGRTWPAAVHAGIEPYAARDGFEEQLPQIGPDRYGMTEDGRPVELRVIAHLAPEQEPPGQALQVTWPLCSSEAKRRAFVAASQVLAEARATPWLAAAAHWRLEGNYAMTDEEHAWAAAWGEAEFAAVTVAGFDDPPDGWIFGLSRSSAAGQAS